MLVNNNPFNLHMSTDTHEPTQTKIGGLLVGRIELPLINRVIVSYYDWLLLLDNPPAVIGVGGLLLTCVVLPSCALSSFPSREAAHRPARRGPDGLAGPAGRPGSSATIWGPKAHFPRIPINSWTYLECFLISFRVKWTQKIPKRSH